MRFPVKKAKQYDPDFIQKFAHACKAGGEDLSRVLYYDCAQQSQCPSIRM